MKYPVFTNSVQESELQSKQYKYFTLNSDSEFLPLAERFLNENTLRSQRLFFISLSCLTTFCISKNHPKEWDATSSTSVLANPIHWPLLPLPLIITGGHHSESKMSQKIYDYKTLGEEKNPKIQVIQKYKHNILVYHWRLSSKFG